MKLVKKEETPSVMPEPASERSASPAQSDDQKRHDICYLHKCLMMKEGKPCPMLVVAKEGEKVTCPMCGTHVVEKEMSSREKGVLYWTDPMMPGYKADKPGKSPMGMDLVPVYDEETSAAVGSAAVTGYAPILVAPRKQQLIGVKTAAIEKRQMTKILRTVGRIAYDPELYQVQAEYLQALRAYEKAQSGAIPEVVEQAKRLCDSSRLKLRLMGWGDDLIIDLAGWGEPDKALLLIDPGGRAWLYATIYEYELPLVKVGQTVKVDIPSIPGQALEGLIKSIDPVIDPMTRSVRVRVLLTDTLEVLKPQMYVNATIEIDLGEILAVAQEAVFQTGTQQIIFVDKGQGIFEPREATLGAKVEGYFEIKAGAAEGERVVTSGNFLIDSESRLKAALEGMGSGGGHSHGQ
jgi:Cu(I)/Ag(I) efflux system membrane fusion protein/cobalt-zinc-cadmium efflux system membrane fusion protein